MNTPIWFKKYYKIGTVLLGLGVLISAYQNCGNYRFSYDTLLLDSNLYGRISAPKELNFNRVRLNKLVSTPLLLENNTVVDETLNFRFLSDGNFKIKSPNPCEKIKSKSSCTLEVEFKPTAEEISQDTLRITGSNPQTNALSVNLLGEGYAALIFNEFLNFDSVRVSETRKKSLEVFNKSPDEEIPLQISLAKAPFKNLSTCNSIPAGQSCNMEFEFTPTDITSSSQEITLTSDLESGVLKLAGQGYTALEVTGGNLDFGRSRLNVFSSTKSIELKNTSGSPILVSYTIAAPFYVSSPCATIAARSTCLLGIKYKPSAEQVDKSEIVITSAAEKPKAFLRGKGISALVVTGSLNFGQVTTGSRKSLNLDITNRSKDNISLKTPGFSGVNTGMRVTSNPCGTISAGATCTMALEFAPPSQGAKQDTLTLTVADNNEKAEISLTGDGVEPLCPSPPYPTISLTTNRPRVNESFDINFLNTTGWKSVELTLPGQSPRNLDPIPATYSVSFTSTGSKTIVANFAPVTVGACSLVTSSAVVTILRATQNLCCPTTTVDKYHGDTCVYDPEGLIGSGPYCNTSQNCGDMDNGGEQCTPGGCSCPEGLAPLDPPIGSCPGYTSSFSQCYQRYPTRPVSDYSAGLALAASSLSPGMTVQQFCERPVTNRGTPHNDVCELAISFGAQGWAVVCQNKNAGITDGSSDYTNCRPGCERLSNMQQYSPTYIRWQACP